MIFSIKRLNEQEKDICFKTMSSKAIYALVGDALLAEESLSIVRMGDGERRILKADPTNPFTDFEKLYPGWNKRLGVDGEPVDQLQRDILEAGNTCTYFAPSVSGISYKEYALHELFTSRPHYIDNFFVNDWTGEMIRNLFEASNGIYILHREYEQIIKNFQTNYEFKKEVVFEGRTKDSWRDNDDAIKEASRSKAQLVLFSGGPGAKIISPRIANTKNKIVIDVGNTLLPWSEKKVK